MFYAESEFDFIGQAYVQNKFEPGFHKQLQEQFRE